MKDFLSTEERQLLSEKLFMNEKCDVTEYIKEIDRRILNKKELYNEFLAQFEYGFVSVKKLRESYEELKELRDLKTLCKVAYIKQRPDIQLLLLNYGCILKDILPEEEE